jgi:5-methylcytosine-specific restriction endonuclease McrA
MEPQTLVLSPAMLPNRIATWQEAVVLVFTDKAIVLEEYEATVSSPSITLQVPAVLQLRKELSPFKKGVKYSPANVMARDKYRCCYCPPEKARKKPRDLNIDHVLPRAQGGKTTWLNVVASCYPCNRKKDARTPQQAGMKMHFQPHVPKRLPLTPLLLIRTVPDLWKPYLDAMGAAVESA